MAIARVCMLTKDKDGHKLKHFQLLKAAFAQFCSFLGSYTVYNDNSIHKNKNSKTIKEIINAVESNSNWLNIKRYRKNIEKIVIRMEKGANQDKEDCVWVEVYYNLRKK